MYRVGIKSQITGKFLTTAWLSPNMQDYGTRWKRVIALASWYSCSAVAIIKDKQQQNWNRPETAKNANKTP